MGSALVSYLNTNGTVDFYYRKAKQSVQPPFGVVSFIAGTDDYTFDSNGFNGEWLIKVVGRKTFPETTIEEYNETHDIIQDAPLTLTGNTLMRFRRISLIEYQDPEDFWNIGGIYNFDTWKT